VGTPLRGFFYFYKTGGSLIEIGLSYPQIFVYPFLWIVLCVIIIYSVVNKFFKIMENSPDSTQPPYSPAPVSRIHNKGIVWGLLVVLLILGAFSYWQNKTKPAEVNEVLVSERTLLKTTDEQVGKLIAGFPKELVIAGATQLVSKTIDLDDSPTIMVNFNVAKSFIALSQEYTELLKKNGYVIFRSTTQNGVVNILANKEANSVTVGILYINELNSKLTISYH